MRALWQTFIGREVDRKTGQRCFQALGVDVAVLVHAPEDVGGALAATGGVALGIVEGGPLREACQQRGFRYLQGSAGFPK